MVVNSVGTLLCPRCGQRLGFEGAGTGGVNYCRALLLFPLVSKHPGLTGWELAQLADLPYSIAVKGTEKLRAMEAVRLESEDRAQGGIRFRYFPHAAATKLEEALQRLVSTHDIATGKRT